MSTCATIGAIQNDGSLKAIHIQAGGAEIGFSGILKDHYLLNSQVNLLISVGNVAQLRATPQLNMMFRIGSQVEPFSDCQNNNIEYGGNRTFSTSQEWFNFFVDCDYAYMYDGNDWTYMKNVESKKSQLRNTLSKS